MYTDMVIYQTVVYVLSPLYRIFITICLKQTMFLGFDIWLRSSPVITIFGSCIIVLLLQLLLLFKMT
jgi:hypothetical protein